MVKHRKREDDRKINQRYWHVRTVDEKLDGTKCSTIQIPDPNTTFSDMYHYYTCPDLGLGWAALRRVPCNCNACDISIRKEWDGTKTKSQQPRFQMVEQCRFKSILGDYNKWYIVNIVESKTGDHDDAEKGRRDILYHLTSFVGSEIKIGNVGAISTSDEKEKDGYYLLEFTSLPYTDQDISDEDDNDDVVADGCASLKCKVRWLYKLPGTRHWYYNPNEPVPDVVDVMNVVLSNVEMISLTDDHFPKRKKSQAKKWKAEMISRDCHEFILDEIIRRESLEYDPDRVFGNGLIDEE